MRTMMDWFRSFPTLVSASLWRLAELHVLLEEHEPPELLQHGLDCVLSAPPGQDGHVSHVNLQGGDSYWPSRDDVYRSHHSVGGHAVHVDSAHELDSRRLLGVVVATLCSRQLEVTAVSLCSALHTHQFVVSTFCSRRLCEEGQLSSQSRISNLCHPRSPGPSCSKHLGSLLYTPSPNYSPQIDSKTTRFSSLDFIVQ